MSKRLTIDSRYSPQVYLKRPYKLINWPIFKVPITLSLKVYIYNNSERYGFALLIHTIPLCDIFLHLLTLIFFCTHWPWTHVDQMTLNYFYIHWYWPTFAPTDLDWHSFAPWPTIHKLTLTYFSQIDLGRLFTIWPWPTFAESVTLLTSVL